MKNTWGLNKKETHLFIFLFFNLLVSQIDEHFPQLRELFFSDWITSYNNTYLDSLVYEAFQSSVADSTLVLIVNIKT